MGAEPPALIYSHTTALCPLCAALVPARIVERGGAIELEKLCPRHGIHAAMICSDPHWYRESRAYVKPGQAPAARSQEAFAGCPDSCGLCPEHRQHTCLPVVEINSVCDLACPVCLKDRTTPFGMDTAGFRRTLAQLLRCERSIPVLNISGGEPTLHPHFAELLTIAAECGVMQTTVSTNGLRLLHDAELRRLFRDSGTIAALQFDGFASATWERLRGRDLAAAKLELIELLEAEGVRYSLVATVMAGVNEHEITALTDFFFRSQALSLMFQPVAFTGAAATLSTPGQRLTIPDVVRRIEASAFVTAGDFNPLPCCHPACFALAYYLKLDDGAFFGLKEFLGRENYLELIANRTLPGLDAAGYELIRARIYDFWSAADSSNDNERVLQRIRTILRELSATPFSPKRAFELGSASMKGIFVHHFMDRDSFDLGRLLQCCNHYPQADGRLLPICAQNNLRLPASASNSE